MNSKLTSAFLLSAVLLLSSGCIINGGGGGHHNPPPPASPGDVTFSWSFNGGGSCMQNSAVQNINITIPGQTLQNAGVYPCIVSNYPGVTLHNFAAGTYSFTITATGYSNETLFTGSGTFTVNGNVNVPIDLQPVAGPNTYAFVTWTFPPVAGPNNTTINNPTCADVSTSLGISLSNVNVTIDGVSASFPCANGQTSSGVQTGFMNPGNHSIAIDATDSSGYVYHHYEGTLTTYSGNAVSQNYLLPWAIGGVSIAWNLTNGSTAQTCGQAGVTNVSVNFQDAAGNWIYGNTGDSQACGNSYTLYNYLHPGTYNLYISASGAGGSFYETVQPYPIVTVTAGEFASQTTNPTTVTMTRTQ